MNKSSDNRPLAQNTALSPCPSLSVLPTPYSPPQFSVSVSLIMSPVSPVQSLALLLHSSQVCSHSFEKSYCAVLFGNPFPGRKESIDQHVIKVRHEMGHWSRRVQLFVRFITFFFLLHCSSAVGQTMGHQTQSPALLAGRTCLTKWQGANKGSTNEPFTYSCTTGRWQTFAASSLMPLCQSMATYWQRTGNVLLSSRV